MEKKRLIAVLLCLAMALSLAGCGGNNSGEANTGSNAAEQTGGETTGADDGGEAYTGPTGEISWCSWGSDAEIEYNQKLSEAFMASHPGTTVIYEAFNEDYNTAVETRFIGGQSPDVIYGHPSTMLKWMQEGMLMDISDIYEENDYLWDDEHYLTNVYDLFQYEGKYFATVAGADTFVLYYNKTALDEAGLPYPDQNTTWEELADMARQLTSFDDDGVPITFGLNYYNGYYQVFPILYAFGAKFLDDMDNPTEVVFDSPETVAALTWVQNSQLGDDRFAPAGDDFGYLSGAWFPTGEFAFHISGVYDIVFMTGIEDFEWDIAPLPQTMQKEGDTTILTAGYAVSSQTDNEELAKEFVRWCTTEEAQKIIAGSGIFTPVNIDAATDPEILGIPGAPEHHSLRVETVPYGQNLQGQCLCWEEMISIYNSYMDQLNRGQITPEECARAVDQECQALLDAELAG